MSKSTMTQPETKSAMTRLETKVEWERSQLKKAQAALRTEQRMIFWIRLLVIVALVVLWEVLVRAGILRELTIGQPSRVGVFLWGMALDGSLLRHSLVTIYETLIGFVFGFGTGSMLGLTIWWSTLVGRILDPVIVALNSLPKIALTPIFLLWFGVGIEMKMALSFSTVFLVAFIAAYSSLATVDKELVQLAVAMGGSKGQIFRKVVVPSSVPWLVSGMKLCIGFALTGSVVGEFVAANEGIGYLLLYGAQLYEMSLVWAGILVLLVVAMAMYASVIVLERMTLRWMEA